LGRPPATLGATRTSRKASLVPALLGNAELARESAARVALASGYSEVETHQRFSGIAPTAFLPTPFRLADLLRAVRVALGSGDGHRAAPQRPRAHGQTVNSRASDRLVVWFEVLRGSRYQHWIWTSAPTGGALAGCALTSAAKSS